MTPSMEKDAVKIAKEGFKNNDKGEAILHIIHTMNQRYGEQWNCVIGHSATAVNSVHGTRVVFKLAGVRNTYFTVITKSFQRPNYEDIDIFQAINAEALEELCEYGISREMKPL